MVDVENIMDIEKERVQSKDKGIRKRPRLVIATDTFFPRVDGISRFLSETISYLEDDFDIQVIAPEYNEGDSKYFYNSEVIRFPVVNVNFGDFKFSNPNKKLMKDVIKDADVLFVQTLGFIGVNAIKIADKFGIKIATYSHVIEWELASKSVKNFKFLGKVLGERVARKYYNKCDLIIVPNEEVLLKYSSKKIRSVKRIVHVGIDSNVFSPPFSKAGAKSNIGIKETDFIIGYHGRIAREKDLITLYRAFRHLEKKFDNVKLLIVGAGVKEEEEMFSSHKNIIFTGEKRDVVPYVQAMDVFVLTSLTETSSLSTIEAMSCGVPAIVTPVGYIKEIIREKKNGMVFPFRNSMRLGKKIELLINNDDLRKSIGDNARETVVRYFSWKKTSANIRDALLDLI